MWHFSKSETVREKLLGSCRDCGRKWPDSLEARGGGGAPEQCAGWTPLWAARPLAARAATTSQGEAERRVWETEAF